jgi:8-amino-7-oxononanoate synthase
VTWERWAERETDAIRAADRWRAPRSFDARGPEGTLTADGRAVVSFASNDYLGLTAHPAVVAAAHEALDRWGAGSGSARLIVGARPIHADLEAELAAWKRMPRAALFPTGFATNLGVITTFGGPDVLVCSDELNHASIIDGCRMARADIGVYRHADLDHLGALLRARGARRALVVTDTVFSMDGDVIDPAALVELCAREGALLLVDEAHAVLGPDLDDQLDVELLRVGTLSKTLGSLGGFVAGSTRAVELIENRARPYIFTTASTPADAAAALAALRVLRSDEGARLIDRLRGHVERIRPGHPSPIIPFLCGDEQHALDAASALLDAGLLVPAIRPPTVPAGSSRLRVTVSAAHTDAQVEYLLRVLADALGRVPAR